MAANPERLCPHLHMSLQSGDAHVLKAMNRNYTLDEFRDRMEYAILKAPYIAITTDVIAGFPGETEDEHRNSCAFIEKHGFSRLHVFPYSDRPGTKAEKMPGKLSEAVKKRRVKDLLEIGEKKEKEFVKLNTGRKLTALAEGGEKDGLIAGYTENYIRVYFKAGADAIGKLVPVEIVKFENKKAYSKIL
jgi:threonylcarbamoyladenosine tRNA methylthiotransferase MtaB